MQIGLSISGMAIAPHPEIGDMTNRLDNIITWVRRAREMGFDYVTTGQHFVNPPYHGLQPVPLLARLAAETGPMRLHTTLLFPLHHPVMLAEHLATLDIITGGKLAISLAIGYREEEYSAFGIDSKRRVSRTFEVLDLLLKLWQEESVTYHGHHFKLDDAQVTTKPIQKPHPPVWVAANSNGAVERAARRGLPWHMNPHAAYDTIAAQVELYRKAAEDAGHPPDILLPLNRELYCAETTKQAIAEAEPFLGAKYRSYSEWGQDKVLPGREDFTIDFDKLSEGRFVVGSPDDCLGQLRKFKALGVGVMNFRMSWAGMPVEQSIKSMQLMTDHVLPKLR